jgi:Fe-S cluster assembly ATP-binding protein
VLYRGRIVRSGGRELAFELEEKGYDWITDAIDAEEGVLSAASESEDA